MQKPPHLKLPMLFLAWVVVIMPSSVEADEWHARELFEFTAQACRDPAQGADAAAQVARGAVKQSAIDFRGREVGTRYRIPLEAAARLELDVVRRGDRPNRFVSSLFNRFGDPLLLIALDGDCKLQVGRQINYSRHGQALEIFTLDAALAPRGEPDWINPPLEFVDRPAAGIRGETLPLRVALIDSGVNYRLAQINRRLARDAEGNLIGFDFWDMDTQPFDANPVNSGFFVQRHGTRTASILLREAPGIELVPYRYPRPDMSRMQALVEHAARAGVRLVGMPLGSNRIEDWTSFADAAREYPHMLFIASAGNDGRNIDDNPVFPAALGLDNLLVVTSSDDFVRPAERTNWGRQMVDYLLPAERIAALDFSGRGVRVSGSSYAVARAAALAARMLQAHPAWTAGDLIDEFRRRYGATAPAAKRWVSSGYIPDPLAGAAVPQAALPPLTFNTSAAKAGFLLPLSILVLDPAWAYRQIEQALRQAFEILGQCAVLPGEISLRAIGGDSYLRDLSTGGAHTLLQAAAAKNLTVVFARDTRMQVQYDGEAFGLGNTRFRPWLANSVWLMLGVDDPGVALAHELYHVLANSGEHVVDAQNLMRGQTSPDGVVLTAEQCRLAQDSGVKNRLLLD